ncbi:MAG TPA: diguanylate cyclase [Chloroflexota bacterium]|nr:diguanylate cyclase [Chloroflexota bacterium]
MARDMDADTAARRLHGLLTPPDPRFVAGVTPQPSDGGATRLLRRVVLDPEPEPPLLPDQPQVPRGRDPLSALLQTIQRDRSHPRDTITGLATAATLNRVLAALPAMEEPAAIVVIALWENGLTAPLPRDTHLAGVLRTIAATLRAHVRHDDLVCRLEDQAFAIVLPHPRSNAHQVPRRLRMALDELRRSSLADRSGLAVSMGFGFWEPGLPPSHPLEQAWQAARGDHNRGPMPGPSSVPASS